MGGRGPAVIPSKYRGGAAQECSLQRRHSGERPSCNSARRARFPFRSPDGSLGRAPSAPSHRHASDHRPGLRARTSSRTPRRGAGVNPPALSSVVAPIVVAAGLSFWWVFRQRSRRPERATTSASPAETPVDMNEEAFLSKLSDAVLIAGRDGIIANASRGAERVLGWSPDHLRARRVSSLIHEDFVAEASQAQERAAGGAELHLPPRWRVRRAGGGWVGAGRTARGVGLRSMMAWARATPASPSPAAWCTLE